MPEPREARSIVEQAEQAAAAGNYASAEDLLREAAALQEQTLGAQCSGMASRFTFLRRNMQCWPSLQSTRAACSRTSTCCAQRGDPPKSARSSICGWRCVR